MINEIDLNDLAIKTDSLPDSWKLLLIDSTTGLPAQNILVSRFIELLTQKLPEATNFTKGLMSELDFIASMRNKGSFSDKTLNSITETGVYISHGGHPGPWGIMAVFKGYLYIFQLIANPHFFTIRCSTSNGAEWSSTTIGLNSDTISLTENSLTEAISLNNSTLPPPRKLYAKPFRISRFRRTICGIRLIEHRQSGRFNSS